MASHVVQWTIQPSVSFLYRRKHVSIKYSTTGISTSVSMEGRSNLKASLLVVDPGYDRRVVARIVEQVPDEHV